MGTWTVTIPGWHPIRTNQLLGWHPWRRAKIKRVAHAMVAGYVRLAGVPPATGRRRITLSLVLGRRGKGPDPDGLWEVLLDSLVKCGVLVDDQIEWVDQAPVVFPYARGDKISTTIMIEDIDQPKENDLPLWMAKIRSRVT